MEDLHEITAVTGQFSLPKKFKKQTYKFQMWKIENFLFIIYMLHFMIKLLEGILKA